MPKHYHYAECIPILSSYSDLAAVLLQLLSILSKNGVVFVDGKACKII
jgi:hypothetical protein